MSHNITVLLQTMPANLRDSHRNARNWGVYPCNGAKRTRMNLAEAAELAAADDEYDHLVVGTEIMIFETPLEVEEQVAALVSYSLEHDVVSTPRSPALADALERICDGWRDDGRIWGGDEDNGYWLIRLLEPTASLEDWEREIEKVAVASPWAAQWRRTSEDLEREIEKATVAIFTDIPGFCPEPVPPTLRDTSCADGAEVSEVSEAEARRVVETLITQSIRAREIASVDYSPALYALLREMANEWTVGEPNVITFEGLADGVSWRIAMRGDLF